VDAIKIENFRRLNPTLEFPRFAHLSPVECSQLRIDIAKRLSIDSGSGPLVVLSTLRAAARPVFGVNAQNGIELHTLILSQNFKPGAEVFINWYRFDDIDRIALPDLSKNFCDIWYPSSDDIEIFDASLDCFAVFCHDGAVHVLDLSFSPGRLL
jgi:hypothetical protein